MKIARREMIRLIAAAGASGALAAPPRYRLAICNETFQGMIFAAACKLAKSAGFSGLEIAPFTLSADPAATTKSQRAEWRRTMQSEGVEYAGLHALLSAPPGLHVTTPDEAARRKSWDYLHRLIDLSADLGGGVLVFGSGKQRAAIDGTSVTDAVKRFKEGLAALAPFAASHRVKILIEPLAPQFTNVVNTLAEAVALVHEINSPAVRAMFDTHNTVAEKTDHGELIKKYSGYIEHVHLNEMDGRHPGTGSYDFQIVLQALKEIGYNRWVSVEVFEFSPGGEKIARDSFNFIRQLEAKLK
jgi:D-psicose/D-tagatose/L-ribulose 3-epimerase